MTVDVTPKNNGKWPVAPKTQAAGLGSGSGIGAAAIIIGLIQQYITHQPLPEITQLAVVFVVGGVSAWYAAYTAPHQNRITPLEPIQGTVDQTLHVAGGTDATTPG